MQGESSKSTNNDEAVSQTTVPIDSQQIERQPEPVANPILPSSNPKRVDTRGTRSAVAILVGFFLVTLIAGLVAEVLTSGQSDWDTVNLFQVLIIYFQLAIPVGIGFLILVGLGLLIYRTTPDSLKQVIGSIFTAIGWLIVCMAAYMMYVLVYAINHPNTE